jgi:hypothetical protein
MKMTMSKKTLEKLLDILEWHIVNTGRRLAQARSGDCSEEELEVLEWDLDTSELLYRQARDETGHTWEAA